MTLTGFLIRQLRHRLGESRERFGERFHISSDQIGRYERDEQRVPPEIAREMAKLDARIAAARCAECPLCGVSTQRRQQIRGYPLMKARVRMNVTQSDQVVRSLAKAAMLAPRVAIPLL